MGATQSELEQFEDPGPGITKERLIRAVKQYEDTEEVTIDSWEDLGETAKGQGFMSSLNTVRVEALVNGKVKDYNWVVKSLPRDLNRGYINVKMKGDEREVFFYGKLLPRLKSLLGSKEASHLLPNLAETPYCAWNDVDKVLVMENLKERGYSDAANKRDGLDIVQLRACVTWLARFHAITFAFLQTYEGGLGQAEVDLPIYFWKFNDYFGDWEGFLGTFRDAGNENQRQTLLGLDEKYPGRGYVAAFDRIVASHGDIATMAMKVHDKEEFKLKTICHCDPWFNNVLFKDGGVLYIDFQLSCYVSPALDLNYLLASSTTAGVRRKYLDHILTLYHTHFINTLHELDISVDFTYDDLVEDVKKSRIWGLHFALSALPAILAEKVEDQVDPAGWCEAMNEQDQAEKEKKMKKMMEMSNTKMSNNEEMGQRIAELFDEFIEAAYFSENL